MEGFQKANTLDLWKSKGILAPARTKNESLEFVQTTYLLTLPFKKSENKQNPDFIFCVSFDDFLLIIRRKMCDKNGVSK